MRRFSGAVARPGCGPAWTCGPAWEWPQVTTAHGTPGAGTLAVTGDKAGTPGNYGPDERVLPMDEPMAGAVVEGDEALPDLAELDIRSSWQSEGVYARNWNACRLGATNWPHGSHCWMRSLFPGRVPHGHTPARRVTSECDSRNLFSAG